MSGSIQIKKNHIYFLIGILLLGSIFFIKGGFAGNASEGDYQKIVIDMKNWRYDPNTINVEANVLTRIYLSDNVAGCYRDLTLPEFGITKYLSGPKDYIEVTFEPGTYTFACSMFMGTGKIIAN